ncbi:MAG TPA: acetamidase/formamidase family protein [Terriglobales bacterium]|nr:acetamidase/formamidase family protein [Terriglobales bacterium]
MKWGIQSVLSWAAIVGISLCAGGQQTPKTQKKKSGAVTGKHYTLSATKENVQWGWLDANEKPRLTIQSGDTVSVETWYHALDAIKPAPTDHTIAGPPMDELARLRKANPGGGPHSLTGPIYIEGAEPGDTLEIRILKIVPKEYGQNFNLPGKEFPTGLLPKEFPEGFVRYYQFDLKKMQTEFKPGIMVDLKPFPGIIAVAPDPNEPKEKAGPPIKDAQGRTSSLRPWKNGSNMDLNELQAGSTLYLPVFVKGALLWTGDSHCRQGNGEMNLEAIECAYKEIELQPIVHKTKTEWPWAETKTHWIFMGFDEDLTEATKIAVTNTIDWLSKQTMVPMDRYEAYALTSIAVDCDITQMVDIRKGVHCMVPKSIFVKR